jgi:uncharacterized protein (DUF983 family)
MKTRFQAICTGKCPQCHQGDIFSYPWWQLGKFAQINKNCPNCNIAYEVEPGFFYGAMYMSYAISIGIMLVGGLLIYVGFSDPPTAYYVLPITFFSLLFTPFNYRISRVLYLYMVSGIKFNNAFYKK